MNSWKLNLHDNCEQMFADWLLTEMQKRNWIQADLARAAGLTTASISKYMGGRVPEEDALKKIAKAFEIKPDIVFRAAGLLPPNNPLDDLTEQILYETNDLTPREKEEVLAYIQLRKNLRKNNGNR